MSMKPDDTLNQLKRSLFHKKNQWLVKWWHSPNSPLVIGCLILGHITLGIFFLWWLWANLGIKGILIFWGIFTARWLCLFFAQLIIARQLIR